MIDIRTSDGNAFALMGYVRSQMKVDNYNKEEIDSVIKDMKSGNYEHLLYVAEDYIDIVGRE